MHGYVVPSDQKLTTAKGSVRLEPSIQIDQASTNAVERREPALQQDGNVNALSIIVELAPIDSHPRPARERLWQSFVIEQILRVVFNSALDCICTCLVSSERFDLSQSL